MTITHDVPLTPFTGEPLDFALRIHDERPDAEWLSVFALQWITIHEDLDMTEIQVAELMVERGWLTFEEDGPVPLSDGRRLRITDAGRLVALVVLLAEEPTA